jgi:hypothetical protein
MNRVTGNHVFTGKEMVIAPNLTVVHKQQLLRQHHHEKYKTWVMPPPRERYIRQKKHDPL